jgi:uncharacterized membrane protein YgcG
MAIVTPAGGSQPPQPGPSAEPTPVNGPASAPSTPSAPAGTGASLLRWLLAWIVIGAFLALLNRSRWGHTIIYYSLILCIVLLALTQYQWISWALQPFQSLTAGGSSGSTRPASGSEPGGTKAPAPALKPATGGAVDLSAPPVAPPWLISVPRTH